MLRRNSAPVGPKSKIAKTEIKWVLVQAIDVQRAGEAPSSLQVGAQIDVKFSEDFRPAVERFGPQKMTTALAEIGGNIEHPAFPVLAATGPVIASQLQDVGQPLSVFRPPGFPLKLAESRFEQIRILRQLLAEIFAVFERIFLQRALAKAVDRVHVGPVKSVQRGLQHGGMAGNVALGRLQSLPQAALQFTGGFLRIGHQQNLIQLCPALDQKPKHELLERVRFARTCRGRDDGVTAQIDVCHARILPGHRGRVPGPGREGENGAAFFRTRLPGYWLR